MRRKNGIRRPHSYYATVVVGHYVTQLAKIHALKVISIANLDNEQYIKSLGVGVVKIQPVR